jgi:hypothetical protein
MSSNWSVTKRTSAYERRRPFGGPDIFRFDFLENQGFSLQRAPAFDDSSTGGGGFPGFLPVFHISAINAWSVRTGRTGADARIPDAPG